MSAADWREQLPAKIRVMQVIVGAMSFGCLCFLIIAILVSQNLNKAADQLMLTYIALLIAAINLWRLGRSAVHYRFPGAEKYSAETLFQCQTSKRKLYRRQKGNRK